MTPIDAALVAAFRADMKAFTDNAKWSDDIIEQALCEADAETGGKRWGVYQDECRNFKLRGLFYFAAHWLAVTYPNGAADPANISATARLNVSAKSVGDESITYRVGGIQDTEEDWLSLTNYGVQFLRLRRRCGMGPLAV